MEKQYAHRMANLKASAIREIFKALSTPGIISLAGGNPSPLAFPGDALAKIATEILSNSPATALQYGITEGYAPLVAHVQSDLKKSGEYTDADAVIITSGGQQGIDLATKALINPGDTIACENPSFIGALNAFRSYEANLVGIDMKSDGIDVLALENLAKSQKIKFLYTIPTFQNPTGITMSAQKRAQVLELAKKYNFYILEDNPYSALCFVNDVPRSIKSADDCGRVIYVGSFSKTVSPGLRVGYVCANADVVQKLVVLKQTNDVHTPLLPQMMVHEFLTKCDFSAHIERSRALYKARCNVMMDSLDEFCSDTVTYTRPGGGLFVWSDLISGEDSKEFARRMLEKKVAIVPGATFLVDQDARSSSFRLNFSMPSEDEIIMAVKTINN